MKRLFFVLLVCASVAFIGCKSVDYGTPTDGFAPDYKSQIYLEMIGTGEVDFEYLGFGEGESASSKSKSFDKLAAFKQATGNDPNVVLASSNSQIVTECTKWPFPLSFLSETIKTYKIWGYKFKIKSITPTKGKPAQLTPPARTGLPEKAPKLGLPFF